MTEESAPLSNISTTYKWTYAVHHIVDHTLLVNVEGLRAALARNGIFEESRGNKVALLADPVSVGILNAMPQSVRDVLDRNGRGGSVCLNSFEPFRKWISRSVMPRPGLVWTC